MNWVLLAGLVRNPANALAQAEQIRRLMALGLVDGSVFSTWHGEFARYPAVRAAFAALGTVMVESPQPLLRFPGHVLHQALSLQIGLEYVPDGTRVLRIRPDVAPLSPAFETVLGGDWLTTELGYGPPTAYGTRLWGAAGLIDWPFYINDMLFYGEKADVARLSRIDLAAEWRFSELAPEQFYHLGPIAAANPTIALYARTQRGQHGAVENGRRAAVNWQTDFWYDVLLATARELLANYWIGFVEPQQALGLAEMSALSALSLRAVFDPGTAARFVLPHPHTGSNTFHALHWAKAVLEGGFQADAWSARLDRARDRCPAAIAANAESYRRAMQAEFGVVGPAPDRGADGVIRRPAKPINVQAQTDDAYARQLEEEVSTLRRLVDRQKSAGGEVVGTGPD